MKESFIKPLDGDALDALRAERRRPDPTVAVRARVLSRVAQTISAPVPPEPDGMVRTGADGFIMAKKLAAAGLIFAAGGITGASIQSRVSTPTKTLPAHAAPSTIASSAAAHPSDELVIENPRVAIDIGATAAVPPASSAAHHGRPSEESDLKGERALLDGARSAFARGDAKVTLSLIDLHTQRFPSGSLVEEREALAVKALVAAGRFEDARARGVRFHARFPTSLLRPAVDNALASIP